MLIYGKGSLFRCPLKRGFSFATPSAPQLFFSCCPLFGGWPGHQPRAGGSLGCFLTHWVDSGGLSLCHKPVWLLRAAQRMRWEVWRPFIEAAFSSLTPLLIDSRPWRNSYGPNRMPECCCQKPLLPPFSPLFPLVTGTFLPLLGFSLPIPITSFSLLYPLLLFILFYSKKRKGGSADIPIIYM